MQVLTHLLLLTTYGLVSCAPPPHPDVVAVRLQEEQLPHHLRSPALQNPNLQEVLPLFSLLHNGEKLVYDREANHVSREEIYKILVHAGFIPRKRFPPPQLLQNSRLTGYQEPFTIPQNFETQGHNANYHILQHL